MFASQNANSCTVKIELILDFFTTRVENLLSLLCSMKTKKIHCIKYISYFCPISYFRYCLLRNPSRFACKTFGIALKRKKRNLLELELAKIET